jgi:glycerol-3-phosphate dehydrogenase
VSAAVGAVHTCDVAVIGAGVVGAAVARAFSRHAVSVALVEAGPDVGVGTSKANTAIWHTGFDAPPGSLESRLLRASYPLFERYAAEAGIALEPTGALLVAWNEAQLAELPTIREKAAKNGITDVVPLGAPRVYELEPNLGAGALGGLLIPGEGIVCPYSPPLAFATEAVMNGARLFLDSPLTAVVPGTGWHDLACGAHRVRARWVVNCAGLASDSIDGLFGHRRFKITARRGELIVFDKLARTLLAHVILPVPTKTTKGVLVSPTVFGNVLLGPTAEDLPRKTDTDTTRAGLDGLRAQGKAIMPALLREEVTATYAGLRAASDKPDYQIHVDRAQRYVCVGGIRSTGLSAALGIAEYVAGLAGEAGLVLPRRPRVARVHMPPLGQAQTRPFESPERIAANADYGRIVCHCERVTKGELDDAARGVIPATTLDGLRRRTRCLQGRCQGFYCLAEVASQLARARGVPIEAVLGCAPADREGGRGGTVSDENDDEPEDGDVFRGRVPERRWEA